MDRSRNNGGERLTILTKLTKLTIIVLCYLSISYLLFTAIKHEDNNKEISSELSELSVGLVGKEW